MSYGDDRQATLRPGILITGKSVPEGGSLGCFAKLVDDPSKIVILSNAHVLYGDVTDFGDSGHGNKVGQPSVSCCCCKVIGNNLKNARRIVTTKTTSPPEYVRSWTGTEIDCAIAVLNNKRPYTNEALYGMITGTPASGFGVSGGDAVEMVGTTSGHQKGSVLQFKPIGTYKNGSLVPDILFPMELAGTALEENLAGQKNGAINQMLILPDPDPNNPNRPMHFNGFGDSGSVLVNSAKQVIGLVGRGIPVTTFWRTLLDKVLVSPLPPHAGTLGVASPIGPVLAELGIKIDGNMAGTAPSMGHTAAELDLAEREQEEELSIQQTLQMLEDEVRSKPLGAQTMEAVERHRVEVVNLLHCERRVILAWHHGRGPTFAAHCLHSAHDFEYLIPEAIDGVTPVMLLERMAAVLRRYGSADLIADVDAYEALVLDWIGGATSIWQLVNRMRRLEPGQSGPVASSVSVT